MYCIACKYLNKETYFYKAFLGFPGPLSSRDHHYFCFIKLPKKKIRGVQISFPLKEKYQAVGEGNQVGKRER